MKVDLDALLTSAALIAPVLRLGGRHEAARVMVQLVSACEQLAEALVHEQERTASLTHALVEEIARGEGQ